MAARAIQRKSTKQKKTGSYSPILPKTAQWPVVQLSKNRKDFIKAVAEDSISKILLSHSGKGALIEEIETTLYREQLRIKQNPWKVDPEDEKDFWKDIKSRLVNFSPQSGVEEEKNGDSIRKIMYDIIFRYADEIAGNFKPSSYRLAREIVKFGFARLLNAARIKGFGAFFTNKLTLKDKIKIVGETDQIRALATKGTVVMVPTHFSNLDSILIGWIIHALGLPAFIYGAGLNLFNIGILAYFMNSLGAYKVDRRKKNLPYLETLKSYSTLALQKGAHSLFFPGGTRSRSGKLEKSLKLGLLSTTMEAQRINYSDQDDKAQKIFIVPVVLNYHFTLEAPGLINEYLKRKGQERYYVENDQYSTSFRMVKFLLKFFTKGSDISVSIGKGMDVLGNYVDMEGNSIDKQGRIIDTKDYFMSDGKITVNKQREKQYTRMLSSIIVEEYHRINRVFASHLAAFTAFQLLRRRYYKLDLYNFLRLPEEELVLPYLEFRNNYERLRQKIFELKSEGKVQTAPHLEGDIDKVIRLGLENVGMYHSKRPLVKTKSGDITSKDLNTLFYYHNRLDGYDLEKYI